MKLLIMHPVKGGCIRIELTTHGDSAIPRKGDCINYMYDGKFFINTVEGISWFVNRPGGSVVTINLHNKRVRKTK